MSSITNGRELPPGWENPPVYARYSVQLGKMLDERRISGTHLAQYLRNVDVQWEGINTTDLPEMDFSEEERERYALRKGDLLVCEGGEVGRTAEWNGELKECFFQKAIHRLRPITEKDEPGFFRYFMRMAADRGDFTLSTASTIQHLTAEKLRLVRYPAPPREQQRAIADYLDRETARLDALLAEKERFLKLLAEKRQALITHAITQGPVPMILSSAPTSPSEQNEEKTRDKQVSRCRLKYLSTINDESLDEDTDVNLEIQYIDIGNVDPFGNTEEPALYRFGSAPSRARRCVRDGDVIVSTVRTYLKAIMQIHDAPDNLVVSTGFAVIRPIEEEFHADYCKYAVRESAFLAEVEKRSVGVSYPAINTTDLANIPVSVYPPPQQRIIAEHLDRETTRLDTLMAKVRETIALLGERRSALIAAAVTGRIDVRDPS